MSRKKILIIVGLLFLCWISIVGQYIPEAKNSLAILIYSTFDIVIITGIMMLIPFIIRIINDEKLEYYYGIKICKYNSIFLFIVSVIISLILPGDKPVGIGGLGAIIYYFINKWIFVKEEETNNYEIISDFENHTKTKSKEVNHPIILTIIIIFIIILLTGFISSLIYYLL